FLFGEANLAALLINEQFLAGLERIGSNDESSILALFMLAQLRTHAGQKDREFERLGDVIIGARFEAENRIRFCVVASEHDDRRLEAALAQQLYSFPTVHIWQADIHDQEVNNAVSRSLDALG